MGDDILPWLRTAGYFVPGVGAALSAQDAYNDFKRGDYGMAALDAGFALLNGGGAAKLLGKGAKALRANRMATQGMSRLDAMKHAGTRAFDLSQYTKEDLINEMRKTQMKLADMRQATTQYPHLFDNGVAAANAQNYLRQLQRALGL